MNAEQLKAKIAADHERLRTTEANLATRPAHERRQFATLIAQAKADLLKLEVQLAALRDRCPICDLDMPPGWLVCAPCWREIPWSIYRDIKTAEGIAYAHATGATRSPYRSAEACTAAVNAAHRAALAHLKQFSTAIP